MIDLKQITARHSLRGGARGGAGDIGLRQQARARRARRARRRRPAASRTSWSMSATACSSRPIPRSCRRRRAPRSTSRRSGSTHYQPVRPVHRRRPRRRARHARIQSRARRPARADGARLPDLARRRRQPHPHHLLRQGAAGGAVRRHFLLVAEPSRGHRSRTPARRNTDKHRAQFGRAAPATGAARCIFAFPSLANPPQISGSLALGRGVSGGPPSMGTVAVDRAKLAHGRRGAFGAGAGLPLADRRTPTCRRRRPR